MMPAVPVQPNWPKLVAELHRQFGSYQRILVALHAEFGIAPEDHATLGRLRAGKTKNPGHWPLGAALLNLHAARVGNGRAVAVNSVRGGGRTWIDSRSLWHRMI